MNRKNKTIKVVRGRSEQSVKKLQKYYGEDNFGEKEKKTRPKKRKNEKLDENTEVSDYNDENIEDIDYNDEIVEEEADDENAIPDKLLYEKISKETSETGKERTGYIFKKVKETVYDYKTKQFKKYDDYIYDLAENLHIDTSMEQFKIVEQIEIYEDEPDDPIKELARNMGISLSDTTREKLFSIYNKQLRKVSKDIPEFERRYETPLFRNITEKSLIDVGKFGLPVKRLSRSIKEIIDVNYKKPDLPNIKPRNYKLKKNPYNKKYPFGTKVAVVHNDEDIVGYVVDFHENSMDLMDIKSKRKIEVAYNDSTIEILPKSHLKSKIVSKEVSIKDIYLMDVPDDLRKLVVSHLYDDFSKVIEKKSQGHNDTTVNINWDLVLNEPISWDSFYDEKIKIYQFNKNFKKMMKKINKDEIIESSKNQLREDLDTDKLLDDLDTLVTNGSFFSNTNRSIIEILKNKKELSSFEAFVLQSLSREYMLNGKDIQGIYLGEVIATILDRYINKHKFDLDIYVDENTRKALYDKFLELPDPSEEDILDFEILYSEELMSEYENYSKSFDKEKAKAASLKKAKKIITTEKDTIMEDVKKYEQIIYAAHGQNIYEYLINVLMPDIFLTGLLAPFTKIFKAKVGNGDFPITKMDSMNLAHFFPEISMNVDYFDTGKGIFCSYLHEWITDPVSDGPYSVLYGEKWTKFSKEEKETIREKHNQEAKNINEAPNELRASLVKKKCTEKWESLSEKEKNNWKSKTEDQWVFVGSLIMMVLNDRVTSILETYYSFINPSTRWGRLSLPLKPSDISIITTMLVEPQNVCQADSGSGKIMKDGKLQNIPDDDIVICYSDNKFTCHSMNDLAKISDDAVNPYTNKPYPKDFIKKIKKRLSKTEPRTESRTELKKDLPIIPKEPKIIPRINITRLPRASKDNIVEIEKMALVGKYFDVITLFSNEITFETAGDPINVKITTNPFGKNVNVVVYAFDARELEKLKKIKYDKDAFLYIIAVNFNRVKEALRDQYESLMEVAEPTEKQKEKLVVVAKALKENTEEFFNEKVEKIFPDATLIKINEPTEKELEEALFEIVANLQGASRTSFLGEGSLDELEIPGKEERIKLIEARSKLIEGRQKETIIPSKKSEIDVFDFDLYADEYELFSKYFEKINLYLRLALFLKYKYEILKTEEQRDALNSSIDREIEKGKIGADIYTFKDIITYLKSLTDKIDIPDLLRRWYEHFDPEKLEEKKFLKNKLNEYEFCEDKLFVRLYRKYVENDISKETSLWFHNSECEKESISKKSPKSKKSTSKSLQQMTLEELQEKCAELGIDICENKAQSIKAIRGALRKERTLETIDKYVKEKEEKEQKQEERREEIEQKKEDITEDIEKLSFKQLVKMCKDMNIHEDKCKTREKAIEAITEQKLINDIENEMLSSPKKDKDFDPFDFAKYSQEYKMFSKYFSGQELYFRTGVFIDYKYNDLNDQQRESLERTIIDTPDFRMKEYLSKLTDDNGYQLP
jgi:hypothetical protein